MCGIAGLFLKHDGDSHALGRMLGGMLGELADRGPDSTGFAIYGDDAPAGAFKATLYSTDPAIDWDAFGHALADHVRHRNSPLERERRKLEAARRRERRTAKTTSKLKLAA